MEASSKVTVCIREYRIIKKRLQKDSRNILLKEKIEGRYNYYCLSFVSVKSNYIFFFKVSLVALTISSIIRTCRGSQSSNILAIRVIEALRPFGLLS